jgi:hypothetical protein
VTAINGGVQSLYLSMCAQSPFRQVMSNFSIDSDPQQQKAAPPKVLVVRSFLR